MNDTTWLLFIGVVVTLILILWWILKPYSPKTTHVDITAGTPTPKPIDNRTTTEINAEITGREWGSNKDPSKL